MAIADDIRIDQNWGPDGYKFKVVKEKEAPYFNTTVVGDPIEPAKSKVWAVKDGKIQKVPQEGEPSSVYRDVQAQVNKIAKANREKLLEEPTPFAKAAMKQIKADREKLVDASLIDWSGPYEVPIEFQKAIRVAQEKLVNDMLAHFTTRNM